MGLPGFGPGSPTPEAGRIPNYPTDPLRGYFPERYNIFRIKCGKNGKNIKA